MSFSDLSTLLVVQPRPQGPASRLKTHQGGSSLEQHAGLIPRVWVPPEVGTFKVL